MPARIDDDAAEDEDHPDDSGRVREVLLRPVRGEMVECR
jgi:hypothetical protein